MMVKKRHLNDKWKKLFFSLLTLNIITIILIISLIFWPVEQVQIHTIDEPPAEASSEFIVRTTKNNLNELINAYIEQLLKGTKHRYRISLEDDVHLQGELPVFSTTVPLSIRLEPIVQDNHDLVLVQKSISIGLLQLPNKKIMEYIQDYLPMPKWVSINPKEEEIYVAISEMDIKSNFKVSVEHFDLEANHLAFKIKIPYRTLGIDLHDK